MGSPGYPIASPRRSKWVCVRWRKRERDVYIVYIILLSVLSVTDLTIHSTTCCCVEPKMSTVCSNSHTHTASCGWVIVNYRLRLVWLGHIFYDAYVNLTVWLMCITWCVCVCDGWWVLYLTRKLYFHLLQIYFTIRFTIWYHFDQ